MSTQKDIKYKFERNAKALSLKPGLGHGTGVSVTRVVDGLSCEVSEGDWTFTTDMPTQVGGKGKGPSPGALGRAALGSCLATSYMLWASKMEVTINSLEIKVEADYDDGGLFASSDSHPGYSEVRYQIKIQSPESPFEIYRFLEKAEKHNPYLDVFRRAQNCVRDVELINN